MRNRNRQRQRQSGKLVLVIGLSVAFVVIALVTIFNISRVDDIKAAMTGSTSSTVTIIPDEIYSTAVTVHTPPAAMASSVPANAQLGRTAKPIPANE